MSSSKTNAKFKDKLRKDLLQNSKITTGSISKFQERVLCPDNPNEVSLRRTHIYQKTVYRTSDIDKASVKPSPGKKTESKNLLQKCELIAEIEKQLKHLQSQQKYLQLTKDTQHNQSWRESLLANQSSKTKKDLCKQECTEKLPNICDNDTRQVCALLQLLIKKNCVKVTDSSTQIETPIKHKKTNGKDDSFSPHLSGDTSSVNVLWKGGTNSRMMRRASVKMVDSSIQVGCPIGGPKHRSTQVSIQIAGSSEQMNSSIRVLKQRLERRQHLPSSESSKSSTTFKRAECEANGFGKGVTNQREDYSRKRLQNKLEPHVKKEDHTRNINSIESSKSVLVLKSMKTRISLTPRTADRSSRSPKSYSAEIEEITASPRKTVRSDNRNAYQNSHARSKLSNENKQTPRREYKTTSKCIQRSFKTKSQQMAPFADFHSPMRNQFSRQTLTNSAQRTNVDQSRQKDSQNSRLGSEIIVSSSRKTVQTRRASQIANTNSPTQSYKDSKHKHRIKSPNDLSKESRGVHQWNSLSVRSNVIDDMTYIIPDTDRSEDYIVLPYVFNPNVVESPPAKGTTNYLQSQNKMSKNIIQKSSVILEDASSRESYVNTSITSRVLQNEIEFMSNTGSDQFDQSTRSYRNKIEKRLDKKEARISSNSDASVRNQSSNLGKTSNKLVSKSASIPAFPQEHEVSDMSRELSQNDNSFQSHPSSELKDKSIRSDVSHDPRTNTLTPFRSNRSDSVHRSDLTDMSIANQSDQPEMKEVSQEKLEMSKNSFKSPRKENVINLELEETKDMSHQSELSQNNASNRANSINSDLGKHEDISYESDFMHKLQKNPATSPKYERKDDIFKTVQSKENLSNGDIYRKVEVTDIIRENETKAFKSDVNISKYDIFKTVENKEHLPKGDIDSNIEENRLKAFKSDVNISTAYEKSERSTKSDLELKFTPSLSKSVTSADQSAKITSSDHSFTLKPIVQSKIDEDVADHCFPSQRGVQKSERDKGISDTPKTEEQVFINSKIDEANDVRTSSKILAQAPVNMFNDNVKAETNQEHGSISGTITEIPSELLNYIQYLQNRLKDCDEMVEKQAHNQEETCQRVEGFKVEDPPNSDSCAFDQNTRSSSSLIKVESPLNSDSCSLDQKTSSSSLIKTEGSIQGLDASLDSVSNFEVSCCCSCCGEEQSTSYHSDIPPFTGCDCMKEGYYQIMRLAYGK